MRLLLALTLALCVPALALADGGPHLQKLAGTLAANPSGSLTVTSSTASLTCTVPDKAVASVSKLQVGLRVKIACKASGGALTLVSLRLASHSQGDATGTGGTAPPDPTKPVEPEHPTATSGEPHDGDGTTTGDHSGSSTGTPPPAPTHEAQRDAHGIVTHLSSDGVAVQPDSGGDALTCAITQAADSAAAAAKLSLGAHVAIVCRLDGSHYVLSGATPIP